MCVTATARGGRGDHDHGAPAAAAVNITEDKLEVMASRTPDWHRRAGRCGGRHGHGRGPAEAPWTRTAKVATSMVDHLEVMDARPPGRHQHPCHCGGHHRCGPARGGGTPGHQVGTSSRATAAAITAVEQLEVLDRTATRQAPVHGPLSWPPPLWTSSWRWYARPPGRHQLAGHCGGHYRCGTAGGAGSHSHQASIGARAAAVAAMAIAVDQLSTMDPYCQGGHQHGGPPGGDGRPTTRSAPAPVPLRWPPSLWTSSWRWYARPPGRHQLAGHCGGHYRCGTAGGAGSHSHQAGTGARAAAVATSTVGQVGTSTRATAVAITAVEQLEVLDRTATRPASARGPLRWPLARWARSAPAPVPLRWPPSLWTSSWR